MNQHDLFMIDEVLIILAESLSCRTSIKRNSQYRGKLIFQLKALLDPGFTLYLTESGSIMHAALLAVHDKITVDGADPTGALMLTKLDFLLKIVEQIACCGALTDQMIQRFQKLLLQTETPLQYDLPDALVQFIQMMRRDINMLQPAFFGLHVSETTSVFR